MSKATPKQYARPGTAVQTKGTHRVEQIVATAFNLLVEEGYGGFSTRKVAQRMAIRLSNLQYYFPTKVDLVNAIFESRINTSLATITQAEGNKPISPKQRFTKTLNYFLKTHAMPEQQIFLREMWALAAQETDIAEAMNRFYQRWIDYSTEQILLLNPKMGYRRAQRRALLIISMVDGLSLFHGHHGIKHAAVRGIEREVKTVLQEIIGIVD